MKLFSIFFLLMSLNVFAQGVSLENHNWVMTDVASRGLSKERLYSQMNRSIVKTGNSICSNRALIWNFDFKRHNDLDTGKIFLFYTEKKGKLGRKTWWYHVSPVVAERGQTWVLDAGFPGFIDSPLTEADWLHKFVGVNRCQRLSNSDTELIEGMFRGRVFPEYTRKYGQQDCYTMIVPGGLWTPAALAKNLLGRDEDGRPSRVDHDDFDIEQLYQACVEANTSSIGRVLGGGKKKCSEYLNFSPN